MDNKIEMANRELIRIKAEEFDKGWRRGLFVGGMIVALANLGAFVITRFI